MKKKISIAIPCYRSESTIGRLTEEITKEMKKHKEFSYEIILVNDCSPDNTFNIIADICLSIVDPRIKLR